MITPQQVDLQPPAGGQLAPKEDSQQLPAGGRARPLRETSPTGATPMAPPKLIEKSVIIHKDENGFGLRIKGQAPVHIEHVHEGGAAWRAGVRALDSICKVNGIPVNQMDHKDVVLMFKSCSRFVALTLISLEPPLTSQQQQQQQQQLGAGGIGRRHDSIEQAVLISQLLAGAHHRQYSIYSHHPTTSATTATNSPATNSNQLDTTSLFAPSEFALDSSLLVDRTRSCRFGAKLNRRDSSEEDKWRWDEKRVAICACCQQFQCRNSPTTAAAAAAAASTTSTLADPTAHKHSIQRQLNTAAREPLAAKQSCDTAAPGLDRGHDDKKDEAPRPRSLGQMHESLSSNCSLPDSNKSHARRSTNSSKRTPPPPPPEKVANGPAQVPTQPSQAPKQRVINKRIEIIRELIDTERTHTERLRCLDELFYRPLKQANFMTGEQLRMVFACHRTLHKIHRQIYRILLSANFDIYSEPLIGSALLEIFEGDLKQRLERAACAFCSAQATNIELLNKLTRRDTKAGEFLAQVTSQRMIGRLGIKDLLASCFQRLAKYPLLLESLLKATPQLPCDDHEGHGHAANGQDIDRPLAQSMALDGRQQWASGANEPSSNENGRPESLSIRAADEDEREREHDRDELERARSRATAEEAARRNSRRMLAISLAEEREFIERALVQSRQILVRVNDSIRVALSRNKLKEIWKRTDKYPGVPLIDITKQQVLHEGLLTLRLSKRSFDVYVLLLNDYIIILTREGQDKYRLKFFTPEGKSAGGGGGGGGNNSGAGGQALGAANASNATGTVFNLTPPQTVYSPVFVIDEHLTTRDAATDENGFYLLCKRKDDSRIYEFAGRSPAERIKWRDKIQWTIELQMSRNTRRPSCSSTLTKSSSEISANGLTGHEGASITSSSGGGTANAAAAAATTSPAYSSGSINDDDLKSADRRADGTPLTPARHSRSPSRSGGEPTKIVGTISYVIDDGIVMPSKMESSRVLVDQAIQVNILEDSDKLTATSAGRKQTQPGSDSDERPTGTAS